MYHLLKNVFVPYKFKENQFFSRNLSTKDAEFFSADDKEFSYHTLKNASAVKMYNLQCKVGSSLFCSELTNVYALTPENKFVCKAVRDLTMDDLVLQPYGYFKKYFDKSVFEVDCLQESFHYIYGLWYGRGERFYSNKPCIRFDQTKDYDICELLHKSPYVSETAFEGDLITFYLQKRIVLDAEEFISKYISFKNAYLFTRGVLDGCGFIYHGESHNSDLGLKLQKKSKAFAELIQMVFQSLGVISYCSETYVSQLFNAQLYNFDLRIRGKVSVENFCKYFGFTNTFKNELVNKYLNSITSPSFVPKGVGVYLSETYPEIRDDFENLDVQIQDFLTGAEGLPIEMLSVFTPLGDKYITYLQEGYLLSSLKSFEVQTGYFKGNGVSIDENSSMIVGSFLIS